DAAPAQVVGQPGSLGSLHECLEASQVLAIQWLSRAEVHRHAVLHNLILLENLVEDGQRTASVNHIVFRDDFKPSNHGLVLQNVLIVRDSKTYADFIIGKAIESIRG